MSEEWAAKHRVLERVEQLERDLAACQRERDAYKRAKSENDDRAAEKIGELRAEVERLKHNQELSDGANADEIHMLKTEVERLRALLRFIEWRAHTTKGSYCVWCGNYGEANNWKHLPSCQLRAALGEG